MEQVTPGVWHWTGRHPNIGIEVSSYYLTQPAVLLDPLAPAEVLDWLDVHGPPRAVVLTNRHHYRDCDAVRARFGCVVRAPRVGLHEFGPDQPVEPYDFGDDLFEGSLHVHEVGAICPDEAAIHAVSAGALAVADGVIHYGDELSFVPDDYMDEPEKTKAGLKEAYGRLAETVDFEHLLLAHGTPIVGNGREALRAFATA